MIISHVCWPDTHEHPTFRENPTFFPPMSVIFSQISARIASGSKAHHTHHPKRCIAFIANPPLKADVKLELWRCDDRFFACWYPNTVPDDFCQNICQSQNICHIECHFYNIRLYASFFWSECMSDIISEYMSHRMAEYTSDCLLVGRRE